ncbi:hypothetical protein [Propionigenium maris]|uniref:hypothetical protein n=1 Tax=Propionigenium maris TaxID=45622 RepID=UPI0024939A6B|nr:hypothetical protein [Propionigenium maris]
MKARESYEGAEYAGIGILTGHDTDRNYFNTKPVEVVIYESFLKYGDGFFNSQFINDLIKFKEK